MLLDLPDRKLILKLANRLRDLIAHDRSLGVLQQWNEVVELGEEYVDSVWYTLTTEQRDYIRQVQSEIQKKASNS